MSDLRGGGGGTMFWAFFAGAALGVGVGLLVAPRPGRDTRRQLADLAQKAGLKASDLAARLRHRPHDGEEPVRAATGA